jgi:predicted MFS family arabinose efflux permease
MRHRNAAAPPRMHRKNAFALLAIATVTMMAAASAPSPIYPLYRERWHLSVTLLTVVFAVHVVGLLAALLTVGSLSDHVGRRPVLVGAFTVAAVSMAIFWAADGPATLVLARLVQGAASGTAMSGLAAGLLDFAPQTRPHVGATITAIGTSVGMAGGAAVVGLLTANTAHPDAVVFPVLTVLFVLLALTFLALPEASRRHRVEVLALRPVIRVDSRARPRFWATFPSTVAGWAATGLFLALVPSLVHDVLHLRFAAAGGLTIAVLYLAVTIGGVWSLRHSTRTATILGSALMTAGALTLALGLETGSLVEFTTAALAIGLGAGLTFNGNLRAMSAVTVANTRSETFAAIYLVSYAALSVPTLAAGLLAPHMGLEATGFAFIAFVGVLSAATLIHALLPTRQCERRSPYGPPMQPAPSAGGAGAMPKHRTTDAFREDSDASSQGGIPGLARRRSSRRRAAHPRQRIKRAHMPTHGAHSHRDRPRRSHRPSGFSASAMRPVRHTKRRRTRPHARSDRMLRFSRRMQGARRRTAAVATCNVARSGCGFPQRPFGLLRLRFAASLVRRSHDDRRSLAD